MKNKILLIVTFFLMINAESQIFVEEEFTLKPPVKSCINYYWDFGDGNVIETADTIVNHTYEQPGEYTIVLISEYYCLDEQIIESDTLINTIKAEVNLNNYISYGPNPYSQNCTINYTLPFDCNIHIFVTDLNGNVVVDFVNQYQSSASYTYVFSAEELGYPPGTYNLECEVDGQLYYYQLYELP